METKDFHKKIIEFMKKWDEKRGVAPSEQETFNHLIEEIGELAREIVNRESRKDKYSNDKLNNAIADSMMQLIKLADLRKIDLEKEIIKVIDEETKKYLS